MPLNFTRQNQPALIEAALRATHSKAFGPDAVAFGAKRGDKLVAVAVFERFESKCADAHFGMLDGAPMTREIIEGFSVLALHPRLLGLRRLFGRVMAGNARIQAAVVRAGWQFEARIRGGGMDGDDVILFSLGSEALVGPMSRAQTAEA
jgi:RimJ/RimL family protein N-acetyltransferase